ncbi:MAG: hypothetical protein E7471_00150 [Ruminococcaceae bacterium]|nr:hypothetical protein [Oscillospiraceae bacterium]
MKKRILFSLILLCFSLLIGCQNEPTTDTQGKVITTRAVMVDDELYFETGFESPLTGRCGVLDGTITSTVPENRLPTENDQSNFGLDYGYQRVGDGSIEIIMDDKWMIFRTKERMVENQFGILMSVKNVTPTGCTIVFQQSGGNVGGELQTGPNFKLFRKENDRWINLIPEDTVWNSIAYLINIGTTTEMELNWSVFLGELPDGEYKLEKEIMDFHGPGGYDTHSYSTYFYISK